MKEELIETPLAVGDQVRFGSDPPVGKIMNIAEGYAMVQYDHPNDVITLGYYPVTQLNRVETKG